MNYKAINEHFNFYLENENQFLSAERYAYICQKCKSTYSFVYANLLMNICSDFESLIRAYFNREDDNPIEINEIIALMSADENLKSIFSETCQFRNSDYGVLRPLEIATNQKTNKNSFKWWSAYNSVKHNKAKKLFHAKQENILNALGALYILNRYVLSIITKENDNIGVFSNDRYLFKLSNLKSRYKATTNTFFKEL